MPRNPLREIQVHNKNVALKERTGAFWAARKDALLALCGDRAKEARVAWESELLSTYNNDIGEKITRWRARLVSQGILDREMAFSVSLVYLDPETMAEAQKQGAELQGLKERLLRICDRFGDRGEALHIYNTMGSSEPLSPQRLDSFEQYLSRVNKVSGRIGGPVVVDCRSEAWYKKAMAWLALLAAQREARKKFAVGQESDGEPAGS